MDVTVTASRFVLPLPLVLLLGCPAPQDSGEKVTPPDETWPTEAPVDPDGDGWTVADGDCDDANADIHPNQPETCNTIDDNCNGLADEGLPDTDVDGTPDCLDAEACDGLDNDGDGAVDEDEPDTDADGVADCVDVEGCDGLDNDGNGVVDDTADDDGDGATICEDCDDSDPAVHPGALDAANGVDDDCDGMVDEGTFAEGDLRITELLVNPAVLSDPEAEWVEVYNTTDHTIDLIGLTVTTEDSAEVITGSMPIEVEPGAYVILGGSVLDSENGHVDVAWAWSEASLSNLGGRFGLYADGVRIDEVTWTADDIESGTTWMLDGAWFSGGDAGWCPAVTDGDTIPGDLGTPGVQNELCWSLDHDGDGVSAAEGDCDDTDPTLSPDLPDTWYDGVDTDCAGDDDYDQDHDGVELSVDCDDLDPTAFPGAVEVCDDHNVDEDCNGLADDADTVASPFTWYPDADLDGYGDDSAPWVGCDAPAGDSLTGGDCDDTLAIVSPGATEVCGDDLDNDCDGTPNACGWSGEIVDADTTYDLHLYAGGRSGAAATTLSFAGDADGDGASELVVAAPGDSRVGTSTGAAYLVPAGGTGEHGLADMGSIYLGDDANDVVGTSVFGGADLDGDGALDFLIGAPADDESVTDGGTVYLLPTTFGATGLAYDEAASLITGDTASLKLGEAMTSLGDVNGDGATDLAISAPGAAGGGALNGAIHLFYGPFTGVRLASEAEATLTGVTPSDAVGDSLASGVDLDGDGIVELAIGAISAGNARPEGAVYVVSADTLGTSSLSTATASITGTSGNSETGTSVALLTDSNGDGYGDLLFGAPLDPGGGTSLGAASLFYGPFSGALAADDADGTFTGTFSNSAMGRAVAGVGDLDRDGVSDFAIGSPQLQNQGALYLFYGDDWSGSHTGDDASATFVPSQRDAEFGSSVVGGEDVTGDALPDLVIGARYDATGGSQAGGIYVFAGGEGY